MKRFLDLKTWAVLVMAAGLLTSVVGCKDYDDDIKTLNERVDGVEKSLKEKLDVGLKDIEAKVASAQKAADEAKAKVAEVAGKDNVSPAELAKAKEEAKKAQETADAVKKQAEELKKEIADLKEKVEALQPSTGGEETPGAKELKKEVEALKKKIAAMVGTSLTSLVFYPEMYVNGVEAVVFSPYFLKAEKVGTAAPSDGCSAPEVKETPCIDNIGTIVSLSGTDSDIHNVQMLPASATVVYNLNPSNIDESKIDLENVKVKTHIARLYTTRGGDNSATSEDVFKVKSARIKDGKLVLSLDIDYVAFDNKYGKGQVPDFYTYYYFDGNQWNNGTEKEYGRPNVVMSVVVPSTKKAQEEDNAAPFVTSDYTLVTQMPKKGIDIAKPILANNGVLTGFERYSDFLDNYKNTNNVTVTNDWAGVKTAKFIYDGINKYGGANVPDADVQLVKMVEGTTLDLHTVVTAITGSEAFNNAYQKMPVSVKDLGLEWKFDLKDSDGKAIEYVLIKNGTNQEKFITLDEATGVVKASVYGDDANGAAVDRTPIVRVRLVNPKTPDCAVSEAFIKILIVKKAAAKAKETTVELPAGSYTLTCGADAYESTGVDAEFINKNVYNKFGMSKQEFHKNFNNGFTIVSPENMALGTVNWKRDVENDGQETYLPVWKISACELYPFFVKCNKLNGTSATVKMTAKTVGKDGSVLNFVFTLNVTRPAGMNLLPADMYQEYWNGGSGEYTYIVHHSNKPDLGYDNTDKFTYKTDINAVFVNKKITPTRLEGLEYEYVFAPATEQIKNVVLANTAKGKTETVEVKADGKELWVAGELVATIQDHVAGATTADDKKDWLEYQNGDVAKQLLNMIDVIDAKTKKVANYHMWAKLQIKAKCDCAAIDKEFITINGEKSFEVRFRRPLDVNTKNVGSFIDGVDPYSAGSLIDFSNFANLVDWRGDTFSAHDNYYGFYGVDKVNGVKLSDRTANPEGFVWDVNGKMEQIPESVILKYYTHDELAAKFTELGKTLKATEYPNGALFYKSNNVDVANYNIYVPFTVTYYRGEIKSFPVKIPVTGTKQ